MSDYASRVTRPVIDLWDASLISSFACLDAQARAQRRTELLADLTTDAVEDALGKLEDDDALAFVAGFAGAGSVEALREALVDVDWASELALAWKDAQEWATR